MARPSKYKAEIHDDLVYKLMRDNKTHDQAADFLGISIRTLYDWCAAHPTFSQSLKKGMDARLEQVEMNLYQRAMGMELKEVKKTVVRGRDGKEIGKAEVTETTKQLAPDVGACCFILKTQRPDKYKERQELEMNAGQGVTINVSPATKEDAAEQE